MDSSGNMVGRGLKVRLFLIVTYSAGGAIPLGWFVSITLQLSIFSL